MTARPGRIKAEIVVDLPRPRSLIETESDARFAALRREVLGLIRAEAQAAQGGPTSPLAPFRSERGQR
jgi:NitT/TauT family transport system ATP-binding protein